jgi:hypothetical protein
MYLNIPGRESEDKSVIRIKVKGGGREEREAAQIM